MSKKDIKQKNTKYNYNIDKYKDIFDDLKIDETYTKPFDKKIKYEHIKSMLPPLQDYNFQADLLMLPTTSKGFKYVLSVVDLWSDELDCEPLKNKESKTVKEAFEKIFKRPHLNVPYASIRTDSGSEFQGDVKGYFKNKQIYHSITEPGRHRQTASIENVNKLLGRLFMTYLNNKSKELKREYNEWTDLLDPKLKLIQKLNDKRRKKDGDPYKKRKHMDIDMIKNKKFSVGDLVYRKLDIPKNGLNNAEKIQKFRMGDYRWDIENPRKITMVLYYNNNIRYMLNDIPKTSFTDVELMKAPETVQVEKFDVKEILNKKVNNKGQILYQVWYKKEKKPKVDMNWLSKEDLIEDGFKDDLEAFDEVYKFIGHKLNKKKRR